MALTKLLFNPGINKESTDLIDKGGWVDGNLVRFRKGLPERSHREQLMTLRRRQQWLVVLGVIVKG